MDKLKKMTDELQALKLQIQKHKETIPFWELVPELFDENDSKGVKNLKLTREWNEMNPIEYHEFLHGTFELTFVYTNEKGKDFNVDLHIHYEMNSTHETRHDDPQRSVDINISINGSSLINDWFEEGNFPARPDLSEIPLLEKLTVENWDNFCNGNTVLYGGECV